MKPIWRVAPWVLLALVLAVPLAGAEDGPPDEEDPDLGDKKLPLADQINEALEHGVNWLLAKPEIFAIPKARDDEEGAYFGGIKGKQLYGGGTGPGYPHPAGTTGLALYTLLKCGVSHKHPIIKKGFNWIRVKHGITKKWDNQDGKGFTWDWTEAAGTYELSVMILALTARWDPHKKTAKSKGQARKGRLKIKNVEDREWLQRMVDELVKRRGQPVEDPPPDERIAWRYNVPTIKRQKVSRKDSGGGGGGGGFVRGGIPGVRGNQDLSATQLAALALYSAHRFGIKMDPSVWHDIVTFTLMHQEEDGDEVERHMPGYKAQGYAVPKDKARGFCYLLGSTHHTEGKATGSMTACGVANLLMAMEFLANHKRAKKDFLASDLPKKMNTAINDGLAWLVHNWTSFRNPKSRVGYHTYYLYGVERCMDMRGKRLLGKYLWYEEGAKSLLANKKRVAQLEVPQRKGRPKTLPGMYWETKETHEPYDVLDTCFALLFLKRATWGMVPEPTVVTGG